jgi:hypothetical protein
MADPTPNADAQAANQLRVTYIVLAIFAATVAAVFALVFCQVKVEPTMLSLLGTVLAAVIGGAGLAWSFWLQSSLNSQKKTDVISQLAGAGAPPPATPLVPTPAPPPAPPPAPVEEPAP